MVYSPPVPFTDKNTALKNSFKTNLSKINLSKIETRITSLLILAILFAISATAQEKSAGLSAGTEFALSTYTRAGKLDLNGQGIFLQGEKFFSKQPSTQLSKRSSKPRSTQPQGQTYSGFSGTLSLGWLHFSGTVTNMDSTVQTRFSILPVLVGARYYWKQRYYLGMQAGALIATGSQTDTHLALAPSLGMIAPVGESQLELSLQFTGVPMAHSASGKSVLQQGGYSFAALRIAYKF
jgi:hypothetical protein